MFLKKTHIPGNQFQDFQLALNPEKIRSSRIMCTLGLLLYSAFIFVDLYALPSAIYYAFIIRIVVIIFLAVVLVFSFSSHFIRFYFLIQPVLYLLPGAGINLMIFLSKPTDKASDIYFAGLILIIMALFSWTYLHFISVLFAAALVIGTYASIELSKNMDAEYILSTLFPNCFFLISASIIGFVTQLTRDQYIRNNFLLQQSLKVAYDKKSEEARDNEYLANHDSLTDLPNRRYMMELLNQSLDEASQKDKVLVIMFIDLNGFKQINDVYGHSAMKFFL